MQAPIGDTAMKTLWSLVLLVALAAACGGTESNVAPVDTGTSVMSDGGTPTPDVSPDSSPATDAAVSNDATPPSDTPVVMNDVGMSSDCWRNSCGSQLLINLDHTSREITINCRSDNTMDLAPAGIACSRATCNGGTCNCAPDDSDGMLVRLENMGTAGVCNDEARFRLFRADGTPMAPTNGADRLRRMLAPTR